MKALEVSDASKRFGDGVAVDRISLTIDSGEFFVLLGPSGCGKSTLLRLIAGLESPTEGSIFIGERDVTALEPGDRDVAMVFQSYALYPHLTVAENLAFPLKVRKIPRAERDRRVVEVAGMLQLGELLSRLPRELSGGQRQRVAIGRAIVRRPKLFLFDEPLSNLDAQLRLSMRAELARLHRRLGATSVYVTHDQVEAMTLGTRIALLNRGRVEQIGTPAELYEKPATRFAAAFLGSPSMNLIPVGMMTCDAPAGAKELGVRPEDLGVGEGPWRGTIDLVENLGAEVLVHVRCGEVMLVVKGKPGEWMAGAVVDLAPRRIHWFGRDGRRLGGS